MTFVHAARIAQRRIAFNPLNFKNTLDIVGLQAWLNGLSFKGRAPAGMKKYTERLRSIQNYLDRSLEYDLKNYDNIIAAISWWKQVDIDLINQKLSKKSGQADMLKLDTGTYHNSGLTFNSFKQKANIIENHLKRFTGFHKKALRGGVTVRFVTKGKLRTKASYKSEKDEMWVRADTAIKGDVYASLLYIVTHELGHRYEKLYQLPVNFDSPKWYTTRYSTTQSWQGEQFAELFALSYASSFRQRAPRAAGITPKRLDSLLAKFQTVMRG